MRCAAADLSSLAPPRGSRSIRTCMHANVRTYAPPGGSRSIRTCIQTCVRTPRTWQPQHGQQQHRLCACRRRRQGYARSLYRACACDVAHLALMLCSARLMARVASAGGGCHRCRPSLWVGYRLAMRCDPHLSRLTSHLSPLTFHVSCLMSHLSPLTSYLLRLTVHRSPFTVHRSLFTVHPRPHPHPHSHP